MAGWQNNIYRAVLDIQFFSKEKHHEMQERISMLFNTKITQEIDELLSEYRTRNEIIYINEITLDTGNLNYANLEVDLPPRIVKALRAELDKLKLDDSGYKKGAGYQVIHSAQYYLEYLEHYLTTGTLRWQDQKKNISVERVLEELLRNNIAGLLTLLKRIGKNEQVRKRITRQFHEEKIISILQVVSPANSGIIINYIKKLEKLQLQKQIVKAESGEFKKALYDFVLTYLFVERGSVFNTLNFLRSLIRQMSAHYNIAYKELLLKLAQSIREQYRSPSRQGLLYYIREIFMEDYRISNLSESVSYQNLIVDSSPSLVTDEQASDEYLYYFLENGFPPVQIKLSYPKLAKLFQESLDLRFPGFFKFSTTSKALAIAKNSVRFFDEKIAEKIIYSYRPLEYKWIVTMQSVLSGIQNINYFKAVGGSEPFKELSREAILYVLIISKKKPFNKNQFILAVVKYISRESNTDFVQAEKAVRNILAQSADHTLYESAVNNSEFFDEKQNAIENILSEELGKPIPGYAAKSKELHALNYFLLHGKAPWWHENAGLNNVRDLWDEYFVRSTSKHLIAFIRSNILIKNVRKNILFLLEEPSLLQKVLYTNKEKNPAGVNVWPVIKNKLNYKNYKILSEANLIYSFLRKDKKKEVLWKEMQKLFASYGVNQNDFLKDIIQINKEIPAIYNDDFFVMLHTNLSVGTILKERVRSNPETNSEKGLTEMNASVVNVKNSEIGSSKKGILKKQSATPYKSIRFLLEYLQAGIVPVEKEAILEALKGFKTVTDPFEIRELYMILRNPTSCNRFVKLFNPSELEKVLRYLFPGEYAALKNYMHDFKIIFSGKSVKEKFSILPSAYIGLTLLFINQRRGHGFNMDEYVRFIVKELFRNYDSYYEFSGLVKTGLLKNEFQLRTLLPSMLAVVTSTEKKKEEKRKTEEDKTELITDGVFIENAGLVLLWPFFSFYFQKLNLIKDNVFVSEESAVRAANLLEYLVTGREDNIEQNMVLNKILCSIPTNLPIEDKIPLTKEEIDLSNELLNTAISRWQIIKNTSIEGFRESFLKRQGKLEKEEDKYSLFVESKAYDVLIDSIPWNISVIKLPWMDKPIYTKWR